MKTNIDNVSTAYKAFALRSLGFWRSTRQYTHYEKDGKVQHFNCCTYFQVDGDWDDFSIRWGPNMDMNEGGMRAIYDNGILHIDRNYFEDGNPTDRIVKSTENGIVLVTKVKDVIYNEAMWFPDQSYDIRIRQNIGYYTDVSVAMVGQYTETRIEN